jgi:hypothetical protein
MKKKDQAPEAGSRMKKNPRRLTLTRETIQRLHDPLLDRVIGGMAQQHTFTGFNNQQPGGGGC